MLMRSCIAKPRGAGTSDCARPSEARLAPAATASCDLTRSTPSTSSVTVCSTCRRGLASMKANAGIANGGFTVDQEFEGAEIVVMRGSRQLPGGVDDARTQAIAQRGARRHFDELLVAPLDRAFAFPQMADRAVMVADDLHLDMARLADQALDIDAVVSEGGLRLGLAARIGFLQLRGVLDEPHAAPAAAGHRLDHDRAAGAERGEECLCLDPAWSDRWSLRSQAGRSAWRAAWPRSCRRTDRAPRETVRRKRSPPPRNAAPAANSR